MTVPYDYGDGVLRPNYAPDSAGPDHRGTTGTLAPMPLDDQTTRELSRAAANVRTWTEKRNEAIKAAHAGGGGVREIARATGLNVATVHNIIKPRSRRG